MAERAHHRPLRRSNDFFTDLDTGGDPAQLREAGDLVASMLVRGVRAGQDPAIADRVLHLADTEGLEVLAQVWAGAPADSLAGALWRLYALRAWVHAEPQAAARAFERGQSSTTVASVLAGVADPPGPDELRAMIDSVLRGLGGDFAVTLFRASAFVRIVAAGSDPGQVARLLGLAEQLEATAHQELRGTLG